MIFMTEDISSGRAGGDGRRHPGAAVGAGERREARGAPQGGEGDQRANGRRVSEEVPLVY